jgi:hypothetical protein
MSEAVRRGPKPGPRLKTLLGPNGPFPYGATMNDLVTAGFTRDLKPYLDDGTIQIDDQGIYRLVEKEPAESPVSTGDASPVERRSQVFPAGHHLDVHPLCEMFPVMSDLAGCGKSRDFGKTVMKRARNGNPVLIKSTGYEGTKATNWAGSTTDRLPQPAKSREFGMPVL